ncbi:hypothetical protein INR49_022155 [Caranx melampygus]|nr:hypothetical protein INR49_022155 [Caranx melampygus]
MSQVLSLKTWAAMAYSSIRGSCGHKDVHDTMPIVNTRLDLGVVELHGVVSGQRHHQAFLVELEQGVLGVLQEQAVVAQRGHGDGDLGQEVQVLQHRALKAMRDVVSGHEAGQQMGDSTGLTAVRPEHEGVHPPLSGEQKINHITYSMHIEGVHSEVVRMQVEALEQLPHGDLAAFKVVDDAVSIHAHFMHVELGCEELETTMVGQLMVEDGAVLSHIKHGDLITDVLVFGLRRKDHLREGPHLFISLCQTQQKHILPEQSPPKQTDPSIGCSDRTER